MTQLVNFLAPALKWAYRRPRAFPLAIDLAAWIVGLLGGVILKLVFSAFDSGVQLVILIASAVGLHFAIGSTVSLYKQRWRISSFEEVAAVASTWAITAAILTGVNLALRPNISKIPTSAILTGTMAAFMFMFFTRWLWRRFWELQRRPEAEGCKSTIVFGAGEGGDQMIRAMMADQNSLYYPVALLDDDKQRANREIEGIQVQGTRDDLKRTAEKYDAEVLLIAVTAAPPELTRTLTSNAVAIGLEVLVLPPASELMGRLTLSDVRPPTVEDLLGREPVEVDLDAITGYVTGKRVLVTGAGGSIGSELSRQISSFAPSELYLLDSDETGLHSVQLSIEGRALLDTDMLIVANIRDRQRVFDLFARHKPEVVFHAAAMKHLTLIENHQAEGIKTNVVGTANLLDAAVANGVERFVNVSTDKAADPTSMLGASKLGAERLTAQAAERTGRPYVSVRFGNVLGSRGSVLPTFLEQLDQGKPLTVTHPDVTRYFMTIPEAVRLVVQAGALGKPSEVMVLDMGEPVKIVDLAQQLIDVLRPGTEIVFTGLRPGEKLHEILVSKREIGVVRQHERITHAFVEPEDPSLALEAVGPEAIELTRTLLDEARTQVFSQTGTSATANVSDVPPISK